MIICKSCKNQFQGTYCNICGEKVITAEDRRLSKILGEFIAALTFADSKLWKTLVSILIYPGRYSNEFIIGKRKDYMRPISLFFLANLIYFLFPIFNTFHTSLHIQMNGFPFLHSTLATEMVNQRIVDQSLNFDDFQIKYNLKTAELSKLLLIIMTGMMTLVLWAVHARSKYYLADHFIVAIELMIFTILFGLQGLGLVLLGLSSVYPPILSESSLNLTMVLLISFYLFRIERIFYYSSYLRSFINGLLVLFGFTIMVFMYRAILFFVTFWSI